MTDSRPRGVEVLIVGAGPTGLVLALWLSRLGVRVRIVDKAAEPGTTSRALAVQARTLEFYRQLGLADAVVERGKKAAAVNLWVTGWKVARAVFGDFGAGISPFPYALLFPQDEHESLLIERLAEAGVAIDRGVELLDFDQSASSVLARLKRPDGVVETCAASFIAGCDGAHSAVREALSIGFPGGTYAHLFYVADVEASGGAMNGEVHVGLDEADFLAVFPMKAAGHARLIGTVQEDAGHQPENLSWNDVSRRVVTWMSIVVSRVNWFSTYRVHHRVANRFREGRAFLLGDAAHIHSPVGGQGMNTGIGDAVNLAWKLASVLRGRAAESVLESFEPERIAFARRLVATTDEAFTAVTSRGPIARLLRLRVVPALVPLLFSFRATRRLMFRTVSQTVVNYRGSRLSEGRAGSVQGGDRLPWVAAPDGTDNFSPLASLDWQIHVYGAVTAALRDFASGAGLPLHGWAWTPTARDAGLAPEALYLVRPDGHVGFACQVQDVDRLRAYLGRFAIWSAWLIQVTNGTSTGRLLRMCVPVFRT